jgi:hypothetical protein
MPLSDHAALNTEFAVHEQIANAKWMTNWEVTGRQSMSSIVYGRSYQGLSEKHLLDCLQRQRNIELLRAASPALGRLVILPCTSRFRRVVL